MSSNRRGVVEIPIVAQDLIAIGDPDRFVVSGDSECRGKSFGGKMDGGDDGGVNSNERRRRYR